MAITIIVRPLGHSGVLIRIRHATIPQSFSAGERVRVIRPHCFNLSFVSFVSNGDDCNDIGVEFDGFEVEGVLFVLITGVDIAVVDGIEVGESEGDESLTSIMIQKLKKEQKYVCVFYFDLYYQE